MIRSAIEVFVRGFAATKSRTHPYEFRKVGSLWCMRDGERRNAKLYRKEEWIAYRTSAAEADSIVRRETRGRFFVCPILDEGQDAQQLRHDYKTLGYRLLATEPLFVHRLKRIPREDLVVANNGSRRPSRARSPKPNTNVSHEFRIDRLQTIEQAVLFGEATRTRAIPAEQIDPAGFIRPTADPNSARLTGGRPRASETLELPYRQYLAFEENRLVGWVRSVETKHGNWCSSLFVIASHRRRGIGTALLCRMLRDDRAFKVPQSVLLSSHTGALLYPGIGYERLGMLYIFAPKKQS
jgi:GNAT superfamily N-acetyltransferase